jgi:CysZ protein
MFFFAAHGLKELSNWITSFLPHWLQWLYWLIWILSLLFSGIILIFVSTILVNIVAGPFNSILSEKVIAYLQIQDNPTQISVLRALPASFLRQMKFIIYYLPRALFYLILFIIPVVQIGAAIFWFMFNGWVFTMQYLDYPMDNHGVSIAKMRDLMSQKQGLCLGFGSAVVLFAMIPLVNFVVVPVAVVGATVMWAKEFRQDKALK